MAQTRSCDATRPESMRAVEQERTRHQLVAAILREGRIAVGDITERQAALMWITPPQGAATLWPCHDEQADVFVFTAEAITALPGAG